MLADSQTVVTFRFITIVCLRWNSCNSLNCYKCPPVPCFHLISLCVGAQTIPASLPVERKALLQPSDVITLAGLSRQVIREQLRGHTGHTSIIPAAFRLPLPRAIQQYILLSDLRRCNVDPFPPHHCHFFDDCDPNMWQHVWSMDPYSQYRCHWWP